MEKIKKGNCSILYVQDKKFKNFKISLNFKTPLNKEDATLNSLLVKVLFCGCEKYRTKKEIVNEFKKLYGSSLGVNCQKIDFSLCPTFEIDCLSEEYSEKGIMKRAIELFSEVLFKPLTENGAFKEEYVEKEKKVLKNIIDGIVNDKRKYAAKRCLEISCGDNPYGIYEYGDADICMAITPAKLYEHYKKLISKSLWSITVVGNFDTENAKNCIEQISAKLGDGEIIKGECLAVTGERNIVKEHCEITQGKLSMGFKTGEISEEEKYAWGIMNGLFGGGVSSKLFNEVREKMSLCYYASSSLYAKAGLIIANAGIDFENYEKTVSAIEKQLADICDNHFTDEELENVKTGRINNFKMIKDDIDLLTNFYVMQMDKEEIETLDTLAEKTVKVKREKVVELAKKVKCETVYFLCGREGEEK